MGFKTKKTILLMIPHDPTSKPRVKRPRLAADGLPMEMFQDVKRACHTRLMTGTDNEAIEYQAEQERIQRWTSRRKRP